MIICLKRHTPAKVAQAYSFFCRPHFGTGSTIKHLEGNTFALPICHIRDASEWWFLAPELIETFEHLIERMPRLRIELGDTMSFGKMNTAARLTFHSQEDAAAFRLTLD